ncbi:PREDICTED: heat shock transcription factor, Y-linked-like [Haliaeetus leucocephalus]|uniref:heat shock transcription factor, Y-linked-like n=1 Tax=Haliaeetus leucocephalus TaxID=52644 RepID=UPI00053CC592|nr:PREDICTED: heat shock transcription factor, Y-linked-like [Haliaeetus leucocephalus]
MGLSSSETSCDSVSAKRFDLSGLNSLRPACDEGSDTAFGPPTEERSLQILTRQPWSKREHLNSPESSSKGNTSPCFSFMKKLWVVIESGQFESIWWGDNGKCVVIHEELFKEEVLARRGHLRIFESETMESFHRQLHLYGFGRRLWHFSKSGSRNDLLAEETTGEFHFYYNPNFRRRFPYPLMKYKRSFGPKNQMPGGFSPDMDLHARCQKRKPDVELEWETTLEEESGPFTAGPRQNVHTSAPRKTAPAKRRASTSARSAALTPADPAAAVGREKLNPLAPSLLPQHSSPGPAAASAAASRGCAVPAVPNSPFPPGLAPPASPAGLAAAAALSMPRPPQGQTPPNHRCLTCTCGPNSGPAGNGLEPQPGAR